MKRGVNVIKQHKNKYLTGLTVVIICTVNSMCMISCNTGTNIESETHVQGQIEVSGNSDGESTGMSQLLNAEHEDTIYNKDIYVKESESSSNEEVVISEIFQPVAPFELDYEKSGGRMIVFQNGLQIQLPEEWEDEVIVRPFKRGIELNGKEYGNLFQLSFKTNVDGKVQYLFPWQEVIGIYEYEGAEYALVYEPMISPMLQDIEEDQKQKYLELLTYVEQVEIITGKMKDLVVCNVEDVDWLSYRENIKWNRTEENKSKILVVETNYTDERVFEQPGIMSEESSLVYYEMHISNVTDDTFDFQITRTVKRTGETVVIVPDSTAVLNEDRVGAAYSGEYGNLEFFFEYHEVSKLVGIITVKGVEELEKILFRGGLVPGFGVA